MTEPNARVILDSLHPDGVSRVTTIEVVMHRFVLSEFNTHRVFSRNSASSRAIPVSKTLLRVGYDPALPVSWPGERGGMQGGKELPPNAYIEAQEIVNNLRNAAIDAVENLAKLGLHKSVANRYLEPWMWHTVIVTADDRGYANFFALRCNPLAQPEMRVAAEAMKAAYDASIPRTLKHTHWHLPLVAGVDDGELYSWCVSTCRHYLDTAKRIGAARCARVSYLTHDGKRDWDADLALFDRLARPGEGPPHSSPMEHVCTPATFTSINEGAVRGNLRGWHQFRHEVEAAQEVE